MWEGIDRMDEKRMSSPMRSADLSRSVCSSSPEERRCNKSRNILDFVNQKKMKKRTFLSNKREGKQNPTI